MSKRIVKYNPAFLSNEELVRSFVVRHAELKLIVQVIRENVTKSNQHVLVIGPRGTGKTMLVLRAVEEVRTEKDLSKRWYPLVFSEESYQVTTPGEFWLEALFHLGQKTGEDRWKQKYRELSSEQDESRLRERALGQLMDFADNQGKRILLIVENFNMLLGEQIGNNDAWALRHTLLNESRVMLLATATQYFRWEKRGALEPEIKNSGKAMFEQFRTLELEPLGEEECQILWNSITGKESTDERVRPLQILTGGSPRLLAIVSTFATRMSLKELMDDLMQLVDDHTEYFKNHLDKLPAVERKAYIALAELWDPATAREVADVARLNVNKTSSLLRRLMERGAVVLADGRKRTKLYQIAERMYNIYYLMRRRGAPSRRVKAVVRFMVNFYEKEELVSLTQRIAEEACILKPEFRREHFWAYEALLENTSTQSLREKLIKAPPHDFFEMPDIPTSIKKLVVSDKPKELRAGEADEELLKLLKKADGLEKAGKLKEAEHIYRKAVEIAPQSAKAQAQLGQLLHEKLERYDEAETAYRKAIGIEPEVAWGHAKFGQLLHEKLERYDEAEKAYHKAIEIEEKYAWAWAQLGQLLHEKLERYDEAEKAYRKAIEIEEKYAWTWVRLGLLLQEKLNRYEEAEGIYRKAIKLMPENPRIWAALGMLFDQYLQRYEEAEEMYRKTIELDPNAAPVWVNLGALHEKLERYEEAEEAYRRVIEIEPKESWGYARLGQLLHKKLERYEEAKEAYRKVIEIKPKESWGHVRLGQLLHEKLERYDEAEKAYRKAIEIDNKFAWAWAHLGQLLHEKLERCEEAEKAYRKAIEVDEKYAWAWAQLGKLLHEKLEHYEEAEMAYRKVIELEPEEAWGPAKLGELLHEKLERPEEAERAFRKAIEIDPGHAWAINALTVLLLTKLGRPREAAELAQEKLAQEQENATLLNNIAWAFYKHAPSDLLPGAEGWAREAVRLEPESGYCHSTLASILCKLGKGREAIQHARKYAEDTELVDKTVEDAIDLFVGLAANGVGKEALKILRESPSSKILEPLVVGLQLFVGEDVKAAAEIMEVAKDVVKRIEERRDKMQPKPRMKRRTKHKRKPAE